MPPRFRGDAIELSGETGTKIKSEILGDYYPLWWSITSGGEGHDHGLSTAIIELNAGTGEDFIADTGETILGSSGHALHLKASEPNAVRLKVVLFEEDLECYSRLKRVVAKNWPGMRWSDDPSTSEAVFLLKADLTRALSMLDQIQLGNSLFFFDPLLYTPWVQIDGVARRRIKSYYETRTEFVVFLFTSDWFSGRKGLIAALPTRNDGKWSAEEADAVNKCDDLFGNTSWRQHLLVNDSLENRRKMLVELYRRRLHIWFRYVLPLPFEPKPGQLYHLFMCSNYEEGIGITKRFYSNVTGNRPYSPDNDSAYKRFLANHPEKKPKARGKPMEWKILWQIIKNHEEGLCDIECRDLMDQEPNTTNRIHVLEWLAVKGYLTSINYLTAEWQKKPDLFCLDRDFVKKQLRIEPPPELVPLSPEALKEGKRRKQQATERWFG